MDIVLATTNSGKVKEIKAILSDLNINITSLLDYNSIPDVIEDGKTFTENALIKAKTIYELLKKPVIADDSGLLIEALNGEPGVHSARYGSVDGEKPSSETLIQRVLAKMVSLPIEERKASFKAVIVLYIDENNHLISEGECHGEIALKSEGVGGFGYDPIFYLPQFGKTMAQISSDEKNSISHRGIALKKLKEKLKSFITEK